MLSNLLIFDFLLFAELLGRGVILGFLAPGRHHERWIKDQSGLGKGVNFGT